MNWIKILFFQLIALLKVFGHPDGAPQEACFNMIPRHQNFNAKPFDPSIHEIQVLHMASDSKKDTSENNVGSNVASSDTFQITLLTKNGQNNFRGFFIQARSSVTGNNQQAIGTWDTTPSGRLAKYVPCTLNNQPSAVTHTDNSDKNRITLLWAPPQGFVGGVVFVATIVDKFSSFWSGIRSEVISLGSSSAMGTMANSNNNNINGMTGQTSSNNNRGSNGFGSPGFNQNLGENQSSGGNQNLGQSDSKVLGNTNQNSGAVFDQNAGSNFQTLNTNTQPNGSNQAFRNKIIEGITNSTSNTTKITTTNLKNGSTPKPTSATPGQGHKVGGTKGNLTKFNKSSNSTGHKSSSSKLSILSPFSLITAIWFCTF